MDPIQPPRPSNKKGLSVKQVLLLMLGVILLTALVVILVIRFWLYPQPFKPIQLNPKEQQSLEYKIEYLESASSSPAGPVQPLRVSEQELSREIIFSEREINSLLPAEWMGRLALAFDKDLISLRLLLPLDPDFPLMGGQTLRLGLKAELAYRQGRPVILLKGVSLMGVPLPNAWLKGKKNIDILEELGTESGFGKLLAEGLEDIQVRRGALYILLRE
jgi:hypothetical protein